MRICDITDCGQPAQLTVTKMVTVPIFGGFMQEPYYRQVCTDCGPEMKALWHWEIVGMIDRKALVG